MKKTCFTILIFFVSVTLAQEDKSEREPGKFPFPSSNNTSSQSSEANLRAAGISFPTWEEIRDSFQKFQEQLNNFRRHAGRSDSESVNKTPNASQFDISNGRLGRDDRRTSSNHDESSESSTSRFINNRRNPPDSDYPPGYIRRQSNYGLTTSTPTLSTSELQRHTTTTIYIICICLVVMVIGSALFMCVNKCQGTGGFASNSVGSSGSSAGQTRDASSRRAGADRTSRTTGSTLSIVIPSESSSSRSTNTAASGSHSSTSGSTVSIPGVKNDPKYLDVDDLPPPYDILFPNGKPS